MKIKANRVNENSLLFIDNLVEKNFGSTKPAGYSGRQSPRISQCNSKEKLQSITDPFLSNLPELMRIELAASILGISPKTIYDWRYRSQQRKIPSGFFVKINRRLLIRTSVLKEWITSQNPSLQCERK